MGQFTEGLNWSKVLVFTTELKQANKKGMGLLLHGWIRLAYCGCGMGLFATGLERARLLHSWIGPVYCMAIMDLFATVLGVPLLAICPERSFSLQAWDYLATALQYI